MHAFLIEICTLICMCYRHIFPHWGTLLSYLKKCFFINNNPVYDILWMENDNLLELDIQITSIVSFQGRYALFPSTVSDFSATVWDHHLWKGPFKYIPIYTCTYIPIHTCIQLGEVMVLQTCLLSKSYLKHWDKTLSNEMGVRNNSNTEYLLNIWYVPTTVLNV